MKIRIEISDKFLAERALNDLLTISKRQTIGLMSVANPNLGELKLIGRDVTKETEKEFWKRVADSLIPYYDVMVTDNEFNIFEKKTVPAKQAEAKKEEKTNENKGCGNIIKRAKRRLTRKVPDKTKKLSKDTN